MNVFAWISLLVSFVMLGFFIMAYRAEVEKGEKAGIIMGLAMVLAVLIWTITAICLLGMTIRT